MKKTNSELAHRVFQFLVSTQVEEVLICAGARNVPLIENIQSYGFQVKSYFEERSAGFFALGRMRSSGKPVAVITTSGTAAAELLPAVIESYYQGLPLIVITADRPKNYRNSGSPQSIEQVGLFSHYVHQAYDLDVHTEFFHFEFHHAKPLQINVCFKEPLLDQYQPDDSLFFNQSLQIKFESEAPVFKDKSYHLAQWLQQHSLFKKPLVIVAGLSDEDKSTVIQFLQKNQILHYAEILSGLQNHKKLQHLQLQNCEPFITNWVKQGLFDSVIRIGGIPTLRFWRDLEETFVDLPVVNVTNLRFRGLSRECECFLISDLTDVVTKNNPHYNDIIKERDQYKVKLNSLIVENKKSELFYMLALSRLLENQAVYIGNSLPIREWDLVNQSYIGETYAHRGANGIDGQISGFLGWGQKYDTAWGIFGDLTTLYDLSALGLNADQTYSSMKRIVVINNNGGQIFNKLFKNEMLLNSQKVQFECWAKMWGWNYLKIENEQDLFTLQEIVANKTHAHFVIEVVVSPEASSNVWDQLKTMII